MKFKQNEIVTFNNGVVWGTGKICGVAQNPLPVIGALYIIEVIKTSIPIVIEGCGYTHISIQECHLKIPAE